MELVSTYSVKIKEYNHIFKRTVELYRQAVDFFICVCLNHWGSISVIGNKAQRTFIESLTIATKHRPVVLYNFHDASKVCDGKKQAKDTKETASEKD